MTATIFIVIFRKNHDLKTSYFFDSPILNQKKILKSWSYRHFEEGGFFLSYRLKRENFAERPLVASSTIPWLSEEMRERIYTYKFVSIETKKTKRPDDLIIFDYFHGITSLDKVERFLKDNLKTQKKSFLYPCLGGKSHINSFPLLIELFKKFENLEILNWEEAYKLIIAQQVNVSYRKEKLLVGSSYIEKLLALYGQPLENKIEGELIQTLPYGNASKLEIYKPYTKEIPHKIDYENPLVKELISFERELGLSDPWLRYLASLN